MLAGVIDRGQGAPRCRTRAERCRRRTPRGQHGGTTIPATANTDPRLTLIANPLPARAGDESQLEARLASPRTAIWGKLAGVEQLTDGQWIRRYDLGSGEPPSWGSVDDDPRIMVPAVGIELKRDGAALSGRLPFIWPDTPSGTYRIVANVTELPERTVQENPRRLAGATAPIVIR